MAIKRPFFFLLLMCAACGSDAIPRSRNAATDSATADSLTRARQDSVNRTLPGYIVDSILPVGEELRRFRAAIGGPQTSMLEGGEKSRDALAAKFIRSLASNDTAALRSMVLTAREFGDLVYPESQYTHPPYQQPVGLVWSSIQNSGNSGFKRLLRRLGGMALQYEGLRCQAPAERMGDNVIWPRCILRAAEPGERIRDRRLFGSIIARHGRYKFVSYANEF